MTAETTEAKPTKATVKPAAKKGVKAAAVPASPARPYAALLIVGGLALGVAAGALIPAAAKRKVSKRTSALAAIATEIGMAFAASAADRTTAVARDGADLVSDQYGKVSASAREGAGRIAEATSARAKDSGAAISAKTADLVTFLAGLIRR